MVYVVQNFDVRDLWHTLQKSKYLRDYLIKSDGVFADASDQTRLLKQMNQFCFLDLRIASYWKVLHDLWSLISHSKIHNHLE